MKADGLFVITAIAFIFIAWVATGGPTRPISSAGLFITPVTRPGEESQGYHLLAPTNPIDTSSYPKQIGGASSETATGTSTLNLWYTRGDTDSSGIALEHSVVGPASSNPNQEYVTIVNTGSKDTTLARWSLASRSNGSAIQIPYIVLPAGGKLIIVTGRQASSPAFYQNLCSSQGTYCSFLNRSFELWAPRDTLTLLNDSNAVVDSFSY